MGKYESYTAKFKMNVAKYAKEHTISETSRQFGVDRRRIREWVQHFDEGKFDDRSPSVKRLPGGGRKVRNEQVDNDIFEWFSERRSCGIRITGKQLLLEAQRRFIASGDPTFKGSRGWLQKWMRRHSVSMREKTSVAQRMPTHVEEKITSFHKFVIRMRKLRDYDLSGIGNMDETAVYFDMPGNSTLHHKGDKSVIIRTTGHEKEKVTVILAAMADGRKLPPVVILKGKREPPAADIPPGVLVKMSNNGWVNEAIIKWWVLQVWRREDNRKMLVWDAFRAHRTDSVKKLVSRRGEFGSNSDMVVIPGGCTGILQPADISWNKPFKAFIQEKWDDWMVNGNHTFTLGGKMRKPENRVLFRWVKESWENLPAEMIVKSFKKVRISNTLDGTEDDMLWNQDEDSDDDEELEFPETRNSIEEENALKVNGTSEVSENGVSEEDAVRDPNIFRETHEKEEVHFAEMSNVRQKFESGGRMDEEQAPRRISVKDEYDQGGEFENEPVQNPDVVKETDHPKEELPEIGTAKNLVNRFKSIQEEKAQPVVSQKRPSPPRGSEKVEYESQPAEHLPQYEGQVEAGVFESEPKGHENVVRSDEQAEDYKPEQGYAKNILNKFKEIQTESSQYKPHEKREITPDRSGKVEYVSEPRGEKIVYNETQSESGVFENVPKEEEDVVRSGDKADEILPEAGFAKSLLSKFKQMESEVGNRPPPSPKKETKEKSARQQFTHEQRGYLERYEPQTEAGEFENQPEVKADVVRSGDHAEEILPEVGAAKKTLERFKEIQKQSSSPKSAKAKEITPPREQSPGRNVAGVFESTPAERADVVRSGEAVQDDLPEQGTTRNILSRFKEIESSRSQSGSPGRKPKEFTPPPEAGVYENKPKEHLVIETKQAESGVLENTPSKSKADVAREREATPETEMPEQGMAKNLVSRWKQLESASSSAKSTSSTSPRFKEFTPPRDSRGPLSPKSPAGVTNGVHPSELPGQYQPQESSVIYENKPEKKEGVYREADTDWTDGMPAPNTTASMLQRFKSIQEQAKASEVTPEPVHRKDDSPSPQPDTEVITFFQLPLSPNMVI